MDILWLPTIYSDPNSSKDKVSDRKRRSTSLVVSWGELQLLDQNYSGTMFANGEVDITVKYLFLTNLSTLPQKTVRFLTYQWIQFTMKFFFYSFFTHVCYYLFYLPTGAHHLDDEGGSASSRRQEQRGLVALIPRGLFKNYRIEISCFHQTRPFGETSFRLGLQKLWMKKSRFPEKKIGYYCMDHWFVNRYLQCCLLLIISIPLIRTCGVAHPVNICCNPCC